MLLWVSLCLALAVVQSGASEDGNGNFEDGNFGLKIEYNQTAVNHSEALMKDRSAATDHMLRELHREGLEALEDLPSGFDYLDGDLDGDLDRKFEDANIADACPPGPKGLLCRRRFALRGADECSGGACVMCRRCDLLTPESWPVCCKNHFLCCRPIARACQTCNVTELVPFCNDKFGRCH